jgi:hypothetical protein
MNTTNTFVQGGECLESVATSLNKGTHESGNSISKKSRLVSTISHWYLNLGFTDTL